MTTEKNYGERIAKVIARSGACSRRDAEKLILEGKVKVNGSTITSPALNVGPRAKITIEGKFLPERDESRLWLFHKPVGLVTTHNDPEGRPTVFQKLPEKLPRVISIGRLDLNSEGLLLLTNDGELARQFELPSSSIERIYRVRVYGKPTEAELEKLRKGVTADGVKYGEVIAEIEREGINKINEDAADRGAQSRTVGRGANTWLKVSMREGKNREIRKLFEHLGYRVNRLIRISFGPFELGNLAAGKVKEVPWKIVTRLLRAIETGNIEGLNQKDDKNYSRKTPRKIFGNAKNGSRTPNRRAGKGSRI